MSQPLQPEVQKLIDDAQRIGTPEHTLHVVVENDDGSVTMSRETLLAMTNEIVRLSAPGVAPLPPCYERVLRDMTSVTLLMVKIFGEAEMSPAAKAQYMQIKARVREIQQHAEAHGFEF